MFYETNELILKFTRDVTITKIAINKVRQMTVTSMDILHHISRNAVAI